MTTNTRSQRVGLVFLCTLFTACDIAPRGTLAEMAASWSGGNTQPVCSDHAPNPEPLKHGIQYCQWTATQVGRNVVGGFRFQGRLGSVTWFHALKDSAEASQFTDSLASELKARGLTMRGCGHGPTHDGMGEGFRWESSSLAVQLTRVGSSTSERDMVVYAVDTPHAMPAALCAS